MRSYHVTRPPRRRGGPCTAPASPAQLGARPGRPAQRGGELAVRAALLVGRCPGGGGGSPPGEQPARLAGQRLVRPQRRTKRAAAANSRTPRCDRRELQPAPPRTLTRRPAQPQPTRRSRRRAPSANETAAEPSERRSTSSESPRPAGPPAPGRPAARGPRACTRQGARPAARASRAGADPAATQADPEAQPRAPPGPRAAAPTPPPRPPPRRRPPLRGGRRTRRRPDRRGAWGRHSPLHRRRAADLAPARPSSAQAKERGWTAAAGSGWGCPAIGDRWRADAPGRWSWSRRAVMRFGAGQPRPNPGRAHPTPTQPPLTSYYQR